MSASLAAFSCQKCSRPVEVDLSPAVPAASLLRFKSREPLPAHLPPSFTRSENASLAAVEEGFVVLSGGGGDEAGRRAARAERPQTAQDWDRRVRALTRVFEAASDKCATDFPLCSGCANGVVKELDSRTVAAREDADRFRRALQELRDSEAAPPPPPDPESGCAPTNALERARLEGVERRLLERLEQVRAEREAQAADRQRLADEARALERLELAFWREQRAHARRLTTLGAEHEATRRRIEVASEQLNRLKRTNVYDDAFHISYDGHFGTINGFRLGRLASVPVPWEELNAALGQVVLLLDTIARLVNFKFSRYTLTPLGSFSKIARNDDPSSAVGLYGSSERSFKKLLWYGQFDTALTWLLECVREFGDHASSLDSKFAFDFQIRDGTIMGLSVKLQFNDDSKWTCALKNVLLALKYLLAWTSAHKDH